MRWLSLSVLCLALSAAAQQPQGDSKESIEYSKKESRMNTLRGRMTEADEKFARVLARKKETRDTVKQRELAAELAAIAKERNTAAREYTEIRQDLMYRYPNKGQDIDKRFAPRKEKTPQELEQSAEIDELLTAIKRRMDKKYAPLLPKEEEAAAAQVAPPKEEAKKKYRLVK